MTKMAATPIYGKNLQKSSSSEPEVLWSWNLACSIMDSRNDITTLAFYDRHGSDSILSLQCNSWKVIHFPTHNMGLQDLLLDILQ